MTVRLRTILLIAAIVLADRVSKLYIVSHVAMGQEIPVIRGIFNINHAENPGAAFSILADAPPVVRAILLVGVSVVVMMFIGMMLWRLPAGTGSRLTRTSLALVFAGALGNLWDRAFRGTVTDFLQVFIGSYEFPSFNVADCAITIGATLLVIDLWKSNKKTSVGAS
jgi:signal peptidase II